MAGAVALVVAEAAVLGYVVGTVEEELVAAAVVEED